jgi:hypothetical protein
MVARVATFEALPDDLPPEAVDLLRHTVREVPGYVGGFHLVDPRTRRAMSIVVFEDEDGLRRAGDALARRAPDQRVGASPDRVEVLVAEPF